VKETGTEKLPRLEQTRTSDKKQFRPLPRHMVFQKRNAELAAVLGAEHRSGRPMTWIPGGQGIDR